ncbi:FixH family protein [Bacillus sp. 37MA]|uniref:FixH family protein n=1 Tax=Bacillus sp. 37MA TaxID=1132442 RepID=UPI00036D6BCD|nr:FixH family protein [Bacillus sp. 37MA]
MQKKYWMIMLALVIAVLSACSGEEGKVEESEVPQAIEVQLEVPETVEVNGKIAMKAVVTQGSEKVADADKVEFEVWEEGAKEESNMIEAKNNNDGTYEAETTFDRDGVFTVQVHVTARGLHTMPKKSVTVGTGAAHDEAIQEEKELHEHEHGESETGFSMHFMEPDGVEAEKETILTAHLENEGAPLEKAQVRYEIWNNSNTEKHTWADAEETSPGEYTAAYTFTEAGAFTVKVHVENDEGLHEHEEHQVDVK